MKPRTIAIAVHSSPVFPPFAFNNNESYAPITQIMITGSEIMLTMQTNGVLRAGAILLLARPLTSPDANGIQGGWLRLVGKARVLQVLDRSRVLVELVRGTIIDALFVRIIHP